MPEVDKSYRLHILHLLGNQICDIYYVVHVLIITATLIIIFCKSFKTKTSKKSCNLKLTVLLTCSLCFAHLYFTSCIALFKIFPLNIIKTTRNEFDVLEELCDVLPATLGPHPRICIVVKCGSHHMLLNLNSILFTLVAVVMRHVEPGRECRKKGCFFSFLFLMLILFVVLLVYFMQMHSNG